MLGKSLKQNANWAFMLITKVLLEEMWREREEKERERRDSPGRKRDDRERGDSVVCEREGERENERERERERGEEEGRNKSGRGGRAVV